MAEIEIGAAVRRASARFDFLEDRVGRQVPHRRVLTKVLPAVAVDEFFKPPVEQLAAKLVAKRVPHDRIHADQTRREMADGKKLHELHVNELGAGPEREGVAL